MTTSTHTFRGKWSEESILKKGWSCVDIGDLSPAAVAWSRQICRFASVYPEGGIALAQPTLAGTKAPLLQDTP